MSERIKGAVIGALLLLLALALIGDAFLYRAMLEEKGRADTAAANLKTADKATKDANAATNACNESIAGLEAAAEKRGIAAGLARQRAQQNTQEQQRRAQAELSTPATVPGDACKSAQDRVDRILKARAAR